MSDVLWTGFVNLGIAMVLAGALAFRRGEQIRIRGTWAVLSLTLLVLHLLALSQGGRIVPLGAVFPEARWNWGGKLLGVLLSLCVLALLAGFKKGFRPADAGFTFRQKPHSAGPAWAALVLFGLLQFLLANLLGGRGYDAETWLFQASMPGLDEEWMYRGVLLYMLAQAVPSDRVEILGAPIGAAGVVLAVYFGLIHGLARQGGEWHFSAVGMLIAGLYGFILLWFRERTASLVFPVMAHNVVNVIGGFA